MRRAAAVMAVVFITVGCQDASSGSSLAASLSEAQTREEFYRTVEAYRDAHAANDAAAIASFWADDIVLILALGAEPTPGAQAVRSGQREPVRGRATLEPLARRYFAENRITEINWDIEDVGVSADLAYALITLRETVMNLVQSETQTLHARLLYVFRREAESWKVARGVSILDDATRPRQ